MLVEKKCISNNILNFSFSILHSSFSILNSSFSILNSSFSILNSSFFILHSSFSILNSPFSILLFLIFFASCNPTKRISQGEYLLNSYQVEIDNKNIGKDQLKSYVHQKPNKRIVGARFHLWLYNSSKIDKDNKWNVWLRKNGEEPEIWQQSKTDKTVENLENYLEKRGYYHAIVTDTVIFKKKKANVFYRIKTGLPHTINKLTYYIPDSSIAKLVFADTINSTIKKGMLLDEDFLKTETKRIENNLRNKGYYSFAVDFIECKADSTIADRKVNLEFQFKPHTERTEDNKVVETAYPIHTICSVTVNANMQNSSIDNALEIKPHQHGDVKFIISEKFPVKVSAINNAIFIYPDSLFRISDVNQTYQHLYGLRNFRLINIEFKEEAGQTGSQMRELDCVINLLPLTKQSIQPEFELTNSEGNIGGGLRLLFHNKSLFGHAEYFDLKLRGLIEAVSVENTMQFRTKMEYEAEASLNIPKFMIPFSPSQFTRKYNPKTTVSVSYNYQQYPEYFVRTVFNTSFGYNWRSSDVNIHLVKLLDVIFVQLPDKYLSTSFEETLNRFPYLKNSYQSHMVASNSYTFVRDMRLANINNAFYIRANIESAGLLLNTIYKMSDNSQQPDAPYETFGNDFSQFVKGEIDLRYIYTINNKNRLVARSFTGIGVPYGNSKTINPTTGKAIAAMPFEKKYYAGGANSMRGWRLRSLGPGSFKDDGSLLSTSYPNNTGDIKLEANLEYRFKLVWRMEGALFMDLGNIWDTHKDEDRPGADFRFDRFYKEFASNAGIGFRFDFSYVVLRADLGMKIRDPAGSGRWAFENRPDGKRLNWKDDFCLSIGIGYPLNF